MTEAEARGGRAGLCRLQASAVPHVGRRLPLTLGSGVSSCAGFCDPAINDPQSTYLEEGPGASISQTQGQVGSFLVTPPPPPAPECSQR